MSTSDKAGIVIEKGVPVTTRRHYRWADMGPDDSMFIPVGPGEHVHYAREGARSSANYWIARHGRDLRVVTRVEPGGVRVWLVPRSATSDEQRK